MSTVLAHFSLPTTVSLFVFIVIVCILPIKNSFLLFQRLRLAWKRTKLKQIISHSNWML